MTNNRKHVLMVSIPAYGHMIALLELARKIAKHHHVTFVISESITGTVGKREIFSNEKFDILTMVDGFREEPGEHMLQVAVFGKMWHCVVPAVKKLFKEMPAVHGCPETATPVDCGITRNVDVVILDNMIATCTEPLKKRQIPFHLFDSMAAAISNTCLISQNRSIIVWKKFNFISYHNENSNTGKWHFVPLALFYELLHRPIWNAR